MHSRLIHRRRRLTAITLAALLGLILWAPASSAEPPFAPEQTQTSDLAPIEFDKATLESLGLDTGSLDSRIGLQSRAALAQVEALPEDAARPLKPKSPVSAEQPPPLSEGQRLNTLSITVGGLGERLKMANDSVDSNSQTLAYLGGRLDAELEKLDGVALRLDGLDTRLKQSSEAIKKQESWLKDNSSKLLEALIGIDANHEEFAQLRRAYEEMRSAHAETNTGEIPSGTGSDRFGLLLPLVLCLLVPLAVVVYQGGLHATATGAKSEATHVTWIPVAWFAGGAGFLLIGIGILYGPSLGGVIGDPRHFLSTVMLSTPADLPPALLERLIPNIVLAGVVAVVACSGAPTVLTNRGHFLVAVVAGALVYPLFGHWIATPTDIADQTGWLVGSALTGPAAITYVALLGGILALSLASGLGRLHIRSDPRSMRPEPAVSAIKGTMLLWIAWIGVILIADTGDLPLPILSLSLAGVGGGAAFGILLVIGLLLTIGAATRTQRWLNRLPFAVLAGVVAVPVDPQGTSFVELIAIGALAGLFAALLMRFFDTRSTTDVRLASALLVGGIFGSLGSVIFGPAGLLFLNAIDVLAPQLQGMGVALILGLVVGRLLALAICSTRFLRKQT